MTKNKLSNAINKAVPVNDGPSKGPDRWEAQEALRTLQRAEEIKRDKSLMRAAKSEAKSQMKAMARVCKPSGR